MEVHIVATVIGWALVMVLPGPDLVAIASRSARYGFVAGIQVATGVTTGVGIWSVMSLAGVTTLLSASPFLEAALPVTGALVLISMGATSLFYAVKDIRTTSPDREGSFKKVAVSRNGFCYGLVTNISNPKALIFFTAFFMPMMAQYGGGINRITMLFLLLLVSLSIFILMALLFSYLSSYSVLSQSRFWTFIPGAVFVAIGGYYILNLYF
nr:LysE family translocator [uncultured Halomonas sp.]